MTAVLGFAALALYLAILGTKVVLSRRYIATHPEDQTADGDVTRDVTVVQPILGGDPFLAEALRRNLAQVRARFLWLVDEDDTEGQRVTESLKDERTTIVRCPPVSGSANPKTVKLQRALAAVVTPYLAVLDDDTILTPEHLPRALFALQSCTLYTGLPCYLPGENVWSSLVAHFVNNNSIVTYLPLLPIVGPLTINGMFYVMRTDDLRAMGGFTPIVAQLCDDYALATLVKGAGGTIRQGITPQYLHTTVPDAASYTRLMHRWFLFANTLVGDQPLRVQLLLFVALGLPPLLLWIGLGTSIATWSLALPFVLLIRHLLLRQLRPDVRLNPLTSILAELLQPLHWLHASLQHTLRWRTRRIALGPDGTFSYLGGQP